MCDTLSQEFARLNQCKRCHNKITDVQWLWGGDFYKDEHKHSQHSPKIRNN